MRNSFRRHHDIEKVIHGSKLDISHLIQYFLHFFLEFPVQEHFPGPDQRTVSRKNDLVSWHIRIQPYGNSCLLRNMGSEGSCHIKAANIFHFQAHFSHHIFYHSAGRCFCFQELFYILLEEKEAGSIFCGQFTFHFPDLFRSFLHITASYINPAIKKHLCQQIHNTGTADSFRPSFTDHMDLYLAIFYMYPVYSSRFCPHTCFYHAAFQSRPCGSCSGHQKILISNDQFSISTNIQKYRDFLLLVNLSGRQAA